MQLIFSEFNQEVYNLISNNENLDKYLCDEYRIAKKFTNLVVNNYYLEDSKIAMLIIVQLYARWLKDEYQETMNMALAIGYRFFTLMDNLNIITVNNFLFDRRFKFTQSGIERKIMSINIDRVVEDLDHTIKKTKLISSSYDKCSTSISQKANNYLSNVKFDIKPIRTNRCNIDIKWFYEFSSMVKDTSIHQEYKYDQRGRMYQSFHYLSVHNTDEIKSSMMFSNKRRISKTNLNWTYIALSAHWGNRKDKASWEDRLEFGKELYQEFVDTGFDIHNTEAENPFQLYRTLEEISSTIEDRYYKSGLMIPFDMSTSGIGIMGMLSRCKTTSEWANLLEGVQDPREGLAKELSMFNTVEDRYAVKRAFMTHWYWSKAGAKKYLNNDTELYNKFLAYTKDLVPGAQLVMDQLIESWNNIIYDVKTNSGSKFRGGKIPIVLKIDDRYETFEYHTYRQNTYRVKIKINSNKEMYKKGNFISATHKVNELSFVSSYKGHIANVIHILDAVLLRKTVEIFKEEYNGGDIQVNHDCYMVHPYDSRNVHMAFNDSCRWFYMQDFLGQILRQLNVEPKYIGDLEVEDLTTQYGIS